MRDFSSGVTLAEEQGMTQELGRAVARVAAEELRKGRIGLARTLLEGLAVTNPYDPVPWAMLAGVERRRGKSLAARVCVETALRLAPEDRQARLLRAEILLSTGEKPLAVAELQRLGSAEDPVGARARAVLVALGDPLPR